MLQLSGTISVVRESKSIMNKVDNLETFKDPEQIAVDPTTNHLYITHPSKDFTSVITINKLNLSNNYYTKLGTSPEPDIGFIKLGSILTAAFIFVIIAISILLVVFVKKPRAKRLQQDL
jgi:hypothetical protein